MTVCKIHFEKKTLSLDFIFAFLTYIYIFCKYQIQMHDGLKIEQTI